MTYTANNRRGFTLIEILVVIALTIVILGLVFGPVISSFNFTRRAEIMVRAQDNARYALEQVSRELADAMFVYDNTNQPINFPMKDGSGNTVMVPVLYAKVDIVLPRMRGFCTNPDHPAGVQKEYPRHDPNFPELDAASPNCPATGCGKPLELRPVQPLAQDKFIVRYFIGLRDPSQPYSNGFTNKFSTAPDNTFVLYRAEFSPYDTNLFDDISDFGNNLKDPNFFYGAHSAAWQNIARAVVTLEYTDLIVQEFLPNGQPLIVGGLPVITPTVKFTPTAIYNDPLVPTSESGDDPEHGDALPTVYKASYGYWTTPIEVSLFRKQPDGSTTTYKAVQPAATPPAAPPPCVLRDTDGNLVFNITQYTQTKTDPKFGYVGRPYGVGEFNPVRPEVAFTIDTTKGVVDFAFPAVDINASNGLFSTIGKMGVSMIADTNAINSAYDTAAGNFRDRYRSLWIEVNEPSKGLSPIANATVVPGSERVIAPDAAPGPNYGNPVRYGRVPGYLYEPGLNQYQLDTNYEAADSVPRPGLASLFFHSYQSQQPGSGMALPPGKQVYVSYQVQNNKKDDSLRANYVTKSLLTVIMGIRIYDPTSGKPQAVQLTNKVRLRNIAQ